MRSNTIFFFRTRETENFSIWNRTKVPFTGCVPHHQKSSGIVEQTKIITRSNEDRRS